MNWSARYIGIPWTETDDGVAGTHCYGLVRLVYAEQFGIALPDYGPAIGRAGDAGTIATERGAWPWRVVSSPRLGDVALFRQGRYDDHLGVMIDRRLMLHVERGGAAEAMEISAPRWRQRLVAIHRHVEMDARHGG